MKVFVTGATGFIGNAVAEELARAGHEVYGMSRSETGARELSRREIIPVVCSLSDTDFFARFVSECQVIVHCAADYASDFLGTDRAHIETLIGLAVASGLPRLVVYTSGVWVYGDTGRGVVNEASPLNPPSYLERRPETEQFVLGQNSTSLRTLVLRPGCVYGGRGGLSASWFESAKEEGAVRIVGGGYNRWTTVHIADLAMLYRLAIESPFGGEIFNGTDRSRFTVRECAEAASRISGMDDRVVSTDLEEARAALGAYAYSLTFDQHVDSSKAARLLGWQPRFGGFVDSVARHFHSWQARE